MVCVWTILQKLRLPLCQRCKALTLPPEFFTNHFLKDDFLFISYSEKIILNEDVLKIAGYDERICGPEIIAFVIAAEKYSEYDVSEIKATIKNKSQWLKEHFPDDYVREVGWQPLFQESV